MDSIPCFYFYLCEPDRDRYLIIVFFLSFYSLTSEKSSLSCLGNTLPVPRDLRALSSNPQALLSYPQKQCPVGSIAASDHLDTVNEFEGSC